MTIDFNKAETIPEGLVRPCRLFDVYDHEYVGGVCKVNLTTGKCEVFAKDENDRFVFDGNRIKRNVFTLNGPLRLVDAEGKEWRG